LPPGSKLAKDEVVRDVRNSETSTHHEELVAATGGAVPVSARRGGAGSGGVEAVADSWNADQSTEEAEASARRTVDDPDVSKRGLNPVAAVGLALLAAVIGAGLVVGILRDEGSFTRIAPAEETTSASTNAENPLGAAPPQVTSLAGEYADGQVT